MDVPQADKLDLLRRLDTFSGLRGALREIAERESEWAGIPMPLEDIPLTIEPTFPRAKELSAIGQKPERSAEDEGVKYRNRFYSHKLRCDIYIWNESDGRLCWGPVAAVHSLNHQLQTLGASYAWGIEQESKALNLLGTLIRHHQFKQYLLTGMFMERSPRSGLTYLFRKLRPTVVIDARQESRPRYKIGNTSATWKEDRSALIMTCLCMHPIGYYQGSWAGAMTPTDDVISHLMLMRGDEPMFWRRANQHSPLRPEAGL